MHPETCSSSNVVSTVNACVIDDEESDSQAPDLLCRAQILNESPRSSSMSSALDELFSHEATLITECAGESYNTAAILHYCRKRIIKPRDIIFSFVGYRAWSKDGADLCLCMRAFSFLYSVFLLLFLAWGPVLQYNICLRRDEGVSTEPMNHLNVTISELKDDLYTSKRNSDSKDTCSGSLVFVYAVPSLMFLLAYLVTCLVLRCGEPEHLQTLLERVYLISACSPWEQVKQRRLGCAWVTWLGIGLLCLALSLASLALHLAAAAPHLPFTIIKPRDDTEKIILCGLALGSLWLGDGAVVVGILLYCAQCHLLYTLLGLIRTTLLQGAISLLSAKKDTSLNSSKTFLLAGEELSSVKEPEIEWLHLAAVITNLLPWLLLVAVPLFMAARLSSAYRALSKMGCQLQARPFGYQSTLQTDIDSFLLYVSSLSLRAKILWIPVRTYFLVSLLVLSVMLIVTLSYIYT
ncbi:uncharacterized protein LOC122256435 [Penaeus japonicus]|uniref:uncharacterized protein LOC122256435 n=1 Tax=Penaeus japonicus TaxID=27405 RepID=UPI001C7175FD|nr:uncharacterized protein LOC122256435 [Penaeus japonicus]XP_042877062.1 uncharacterized protein LOC122256435 [Penaeus japonicus]XP_042877063.1 uncharacterized protein LOC122256435 [Penaeus japonicus]